MPTGLGDEELWLSPTVANNVNPFDDQSGNGNNGTGQGGITTIADTGAGGSYCYDFDGVNDHISCSTLGSGSKDAFAVSMWGNASGNQTSYPVSLQGTVSSANNSVDVYITASPNRIACWIRPNSGITYQTQSLIGVWTHLAFSRDAGSGTIKYYVNGVSTVSSSNSDLASFANGLNVGVWGNGSSGRYDGLMDDIRIYDRALTQAEITHLASSRGVLGPPGGAANYSPFRNAKYINKTYQIPRFG